MQVGLRDPKNLPVSGIEQTKKLLDLAIPSNGMMKNWKYQSGSVGWLRGRL